VHLPNLEQSDKILIASNIAILLYGSLTSSYVARIAELRDKNEEFMIMEIVLLQAQLEK